MTAVPFRHRITDRRPVVGHDGRSGAVLERGLLDGTTPVVVKTVPHHMSTGPDAAATLTGAAQVELGLWRSGAFTRLPPSITTALLDIDVVDDAVVTITRDLGPSMLTWDRTLTAAQVRQLFAAASAMHQRFADDPPGGLVPLEARVSLFASRRWAGLGPPHHQLAAAVGRGEELLLQLLPGEVAAAVAAHLAEPASLAAALGRCGHTLLHGDFWPVNLAIEADQVVALDWELATAGPPLIDLLSFCAAAMAHVRLDRDGLLAAAADALRWCTDADGMALGAFWVLLDTGWNKALDAVDHADPAVRARQRADLEFWVGHAQRALHRGILPRPSATPALAQSGPTARSRSLEGA